MLAKSVEVYSTLFDVSECSRIDIRLDTSRTARMGSDGLYVYCMAPAVVCCVNFVSTWT